MKKIVLSTAIAAALGTASMGAHAALAAGSVLSFDGTQSYFTMNGSTANTFVPAYEGQFITSNEGLVIGSTQGASGSHGGSVDGSESPSIDNAWNFFFNTGMHQTTSNSTILTDDGAGNVTLDFSGWSVTWNGIADIPMGAGAWAGNAEGVANLTCANTCGDGDTYVLTYSATVPDGDPSNFGGVGYYIKLTGTISAVPVPAAAWLFGSGLIGLVGVARRKKASA